MKISIITVTFNSGRYLDETIRSVIGQTFPGIEYIIIDGGSTDNTLEIVQKYKDQISYFSSEPDRNMYDAINKGLRQVTGDYILILNSDDVLADAGCLQRVASAMRNNPADGYVTNLITTYDSGREKRRRHYKVNFKGLLLSGHSTFLPHPCLFVSRRVNEQLGGYDVRYNYASDYDYILRMLSIRGLRLQYLPVYTTRFRLHGASITSSGKIDQERVAILRKHGYHSYPLFQRSIAGAVGWMKYLALNMDNYIRFFFGKTARVE